MTLQWKANRTQAELTGGQSLRKVAVPRRRDLPDHPLVPFAVPELIS